LNYPGGAPFTLNANGDAVWDSAAGTKFLTTAMTDPTRAKQAWVTVIAYMLSHYDFIYE
jgi:hypothetical protein